MRSRWWRRVDPRAGLLWLLLPLAASCVYYNTFFLAKKSFHAAERSVAESKTDKLPSDAERNYDLTLQQCRKVLASHHKSKWADDALYLMGASYYGKGDYDSALVRLAQIPEMFPKSEFRDDALFLTAMAKNKKREHDEAKQLFEKVIADYPKFEKRDEILFTLAESAASQRKREAVSYTHLR
ncbi:MAG: tetratricopeptide repeat protein, partial [Candidatus Eisenbacteria bacterium]|nr:tetratricopeptide repeat protein [Candidatus Eisenbacteria bacterium]